MKFRKAGCLLLSLILTAALLAGCGNSPATQEETTTGEAATQAPETAAPDTSAPAETTEAPQESESSDPAEESTEAPTEEPTEATKEEPTEETTETQPETEEPEEGILSRKAEEYRFVITEMEAAEGWSGQEYQIHFLLENKADYDLRLTWYDVNINGYMTSQIVYETADKGGTLEGTYAVYQDELDSCGIEEPEELSFLLIIQNDEDYYEDPLLSEIVTCYPTGLSAEDIKVPDRPESEDEIVVVDNDKISFIFFPEAEEGWYGKSYKVFLENKTDKSLSFSWDETCVNGYANDPVWGRVVAAGKKAIDTISFTDTQLERCHIESFDEISFLLKVYSARNYEDLFEERFALYPTGKKPEEVVVPDRPESENEKVIIDNDQMTIIFVDEEEDSWGYHTATVYFENKSEVELFFVFDNVEANGQEMTAWWGNVVPAGRRSVRNLSVNNEVYTESGKERIETLHFTLRAYDDNDLFADDILEETEFTIDFVTESENEAESETDSE
ncbi:MAG: hypothetical protein II882_02640 [Lachnospiraceae bacterium]|nr:hypothetical protein [Lachnospiraceae bacterium]